MPRSSFQRPSRIRAIGPKLLIACEGAGEKAYLEAIRQLLRLSDKQIIVLNEKGTDPLTIVRTVIKYRAGLKQDDAWLTQDSAWVAMDGDEHRDNNPKNWHQALNLAQDNQIELALSNPSLELWYLLHFQDEQAYIHRDKAMIELKKHVPSYQKPQPLPSVRPDARLAAIGRAAYLEKRNREMGQEPHSNPSSGMGKLVELLLELGKSL